MHPIILVVPYYHRSGVVNGRHLAMEELWFSPALVHMRFVTAEIIWGRSLSEWHNIVTLWTADVSLRHYH